MKHQRGVKRYRSWDIDGPLLIFVNILLQAFWLKTDFNKWKDEDESDDDDMGKNMDLAEVIYT